MKNFKSLTKLPMKYNANIAVSLGGAMSLFSSKSKTKTHKDPAYPSNLLHCYYVKMFVLQRKYISDLSKTINSYLER